MGKLVYADGSLQLDIDDQRLNPAMLVVVDADLGVDLEAAHEDLGHDDPGQVLGRHRGGGGFDEGSCGQAVAS